MTFSPFDGHNVNKIAFPSADLPPLAQRGACLILICHRSPVHLATIMTTTLTIRDESVGGDTLHEFALEILTERITVRELIRSRVYQEVQDYNQRQPEVYQGLVQPDDAEQTLNGCKLDKSRTIDWRRQYEKALDAFESDRVLVLVDDRQVDTLDDEIVIRPGTSVSFLRLTLLTGG